MESGSGLILASLLVLGVLCTCCISEDTPGPVPVGGDVPVAGVPLRSIGDVTGEGVILQGVPRGTVDTVTFGVGLAPGVKTADMNNLTVIYADAVRIEKLLPVEGYRGSPPPGYWGIIAVKNEAGTPNMRLDFDEQFILRINPKAPLVPNQVITISVKPEGEKPLIIRRVAPSTIVEHENILPAI